MNELLTRISSWPPNRWLMFGGMLGVFFFGSTGVGDFTPNPGISMLATGLSFVVIILGAWYAREAKRFESEERRESNRPESPCSELSIELALTMTKPMNAEEVSNLHPIQNDAKKTKVELLKTINRLRIREAAANGRVIFYSEGIYTPRLDHTVLAR